VFIQDNIKIIRNIISVAKTIQLTILIHTNVKL